VCWIRIPPACCEYDDADSGCKGQISPMEGTRMIILLIILVILLFTGIPSFPVGYNRAGRYGYYPSGIFVILLIVLILYLTRVI
jgi:hypothetical protein